MVERGNCSAHLGSDRVDRVDRVKDYDRMKYVYIISLLELIRLTQ